MDSIPRDEPGSNGEYDGNRQDIVLSYFYVSPSFFYDEGESFLSEKQDFWETGFPHVQSGDLDSDGVKEILVTLSYDTSTDPYSFGDMWLFDKDEASREYKEVELPLAKTENGGKGYEVEYDKPEDGKITFNVKEAGLSMTEEVGDDYLSNWWSDDYTSETRVVYYAEINGTDSPVLRCYIEPIHRWPLELGFNLNYNNGKYEAGYIEIDDPYTP